MRNSINKVLALLTVAVSQHFFHLLVELLHLPGPLVVSYMSLRLVLWTCSKARKATEAIQDSTSF